MKKSFPPLLCVCFFMLMLLLYPQEMLSAAERGVKLWLYQVLPSLFPFMVACSFLIGLGSAQRLSLLLQPVMRPVFGLPGISALPFFLGFLSGYPMGAKITASLYEQGEITLPEAERILTFSNNPGILFLAGTVGTALFNAPSLGYELFLCCFLGAAANGVLFRFLYPLPNTSAPSFHTININEGAVLPKAVSDSVNTITQIGGYIIIFSVITEALKQSGILLIISRVFSFLPFSSQFIYALLGGLLEMTNGAYLLSLSAESPLFRLTALCAVVSFGGLSILCQSFGVLGNIAIKKSRYIAAKISNSVLSSMCFVLLHPLWEKGVQKTTPAISYFTEKILPQPFSMISLHLILTLIIFILALKYRR